MKRAVYSKGLIAQLFSFEMVGLLTTKVFFVMGIMRISNFLDWSTKNAFGPEIRQIDLSAINRDLKGQVKYWRSAL